MHVALKWLRAVVVCAVGLASVTDTAMAGPMDLFVLNWGNGTVRHLSSTGEDLGQIASGLTSPTTITTDLEGNLWVSDYGNQKVRKYSPTGEELLSFDTPFNNSGAIVGPDGNLYVGEYFPGVPFSVYAC